MPQVKVSKKVKGDEKAVYKAVKAYMKERDTLKKLGGKIKWQDKSHSAMIEGKQFEGELLVEESGASSNVTIQIDLPFLMAPFAGKVKEELKKHLSRLKV